MIENTAPHIWTRRPKLLEARAAILSCGPKMRGFFKMEAVRPNGTRRLLADWFPNLITDVGLNKIGTDASWLAFCRVGTGSTTPATTDTGLAAQLAETSDRQTNTTAVNVSTPPYYCSRTITYRFAAGVAAGNLAEVGIASNQIADAADVLWSRALILDSSGDPTTITVLSDEVLDVTYQLRFYPPASDVVHTVNISGTDYTVTERASVINNAALWGGGNVGFLGGFNGQAAYDGAIGAVTSTPSGSSASASGNTNASYGNNNNYRDNTTTFGLTSANFAGGIDAIVAIGGASGGGGGQMQFGFVPAIPKISSTILTLVLRHSWGRGQS